MPVRLVAIDIDGTLVDSRGRIPDENLSAIAEAVAAGVHVALITGRSYPFAREVAGVLPPSVTIIASNGAGPLAARAVPVAAGRGAGLASRP